ncbi:hypothetical protein WGT02_31745 (plasmid) [Rhizobium sp. T1470]|uniref:hypothetical protein n=1 Tax=unclassified Rhizobium TaxID=2613769 RepID=UPI001AAEC067|nr:hypothetical protein [Rhizobium sp. T1473]MCA0805882.1 hypothetical protein [Rhizobium sp. T1473]
MTLSTVGLSSSAVADEFAGREQLRASSAEFRKEVIHITEGVFAAVGYSASNVTIAALSATPDQIEVAGLKGVKRARSSRSYPYAEGRGIGSRAGALADVW